MVADLSYSGSKALFDELGVHDAIAESYGIYVQIENGKILEGSEAANYIQSLGQENVGEVIPGTFKSTDMSADMSCPVSDRVLSDAAKGTLARGSGL